MKVSEVRVGFGGDSPTRVVPLDVGKPEVNSHTLITRVDGWVLPFLNVYGFAGYSWVDTSVPITVDGPMQGPPVDILINEVFTGPTYGIGTTLVGGYESIFVMFDANYSIVDLEQFSSEIQKTTVGIRSGLRGTWQELTGAVWIGAMWLEPETTLEGTVETGVALLDPVAFSVDQTTDKPWNFLMGFHWEASPHCMLTFEGGVGPRRQVTTGAMIRF